MYEVYEEQEAYETEFRGMTEEDLEAMSAWYEAQKEEEDPMGGYWEEQGNYFDGR